MTTPYNPVVVNTGGKLVVIDTGTGEAALASSKGQTGQFHDQSGRPASIATPIDIVMISHFHGDHINGLLTPDNKPAFPNAEILVPAVEWKYFMDDGEMSRAPKGRMETVFKNLRRVFDAQGRKVTQYEAGKEVAPGHHRRWRRPAIRPATCRSSSHRATARCLCRATSPTCRGCSCAIRAGTASTTRTAAMAEATRRKVYDMLAAEKMMVQGFHYPFPSHAFIEKTATGYREVPVPWNPTI